MKTKLFLIAALVIAVAMISCSEDDNNNEYYPLTKWVGGKWKLTKMRVVTTDTDFDNGWSKTETTDYSNDSIIYYFQFEKDYEFVDKYWTPKWKLIVHNNISSGFSDDIQESGEYFYKFRQYSTYQSERDNLSDWYSLPAPYAGNLNITNIDSSVVCFMHCYAYERGNANYLDVKESTDTMIISNNRDQGGWLYDENGNRIDWQKYFVRVK
jgi:hypothetical protein